MSHCWGIVGVSKIAHDFCTALTSNLTETPHKIVAIASKSQELAKEFAKSHGISSAYGTYKELAQDPIVTIVYITVLNPQHFEITKLMLEHNKNVLCEKPLAMNLAQAEILFAIAEDRNLFIMEGLWSRFFPVYRHFSSLLNSQSVGDVKEIYIKHGFFGTENDRITQKYMGGGIVLDIGCYAIQFAIFVYGEAPKTVKASGKLNSQGIDMYFEAELVFSKGRKANIICTGLEELQNHATLITTKGPIWIPTYWCPTKYLVLGKIHEWELPDFNDKMNYTNSVGLKYEADEVLKCIESKKTHCNIVTPKDSLIIAKVQTEIRKQIGVRYDCD